MTFCPEEATLPNIEECNTKLSAVRKPQTRQRRKWIDVRIDDSQRIRMLLDTGSDITVLSREKAIKLNLLKKMKPIRKVSCVSASGSNIKLIGKLSDVLLDLQGAVVVDTVWIAEELLDDAIVGGSTIEQLDELHIQYRGKHPVLKVSSVARNQHAPVKIHSA